MADKVINAPTRRPAGGVSGLLLPAQAIGAGWNRVHHCDALTLLKALPSGSVHCCITSPPYYGLRDYGVAGQIGLEDTPQAYVARLVAVFREVRRVLRDDSTCWINLGDSYNSGSNFNHDKSGLGKGNRYAENGTSSRHLLSNLSAKNLLGIPWRVAFALQDDGWILRSDIIWAKPSPMPESVTDRPTRAHEYVFLLAKSSRYYYDADAIAERAVSGDPNQPRGSKGVIGQVNGGLRKQDELGKRTYTGFNERYFSKPARETRNKRTVWTVATQPFPEAHFATFPPKLIEPMLRAGCPAGGVVLDPFFGSGTTGYVAQRLGRQFIGCDISAEYCAIARKRLAEPYTLPMFEGTA